MKKPIQVVLLFLSSFAFLAASAQQAEYGQASFYDDSFQGSMTAYNVKYDKNELTASHKIYPFGTLLRVTRLDNKKSVIVKVIDKGPYIKGRVVDLSKKAAIQLGLIDDGVANVKVELYQKSASTQTPSVAVNKTATTKKVTPVPEEVPAGFDAPPKATTKQPTRIVSNTDPTTQPKAKTTAVATKTTTTDPKLAPKSGTKTATARLVKQDYTQYGLYKIQLERPVKKGFGVQVASLANYDSVLKQIADLQAKSFDNILVSIEKGAKNKTSYKIILGPQETESSANAYKTSLKKRYKINGFVVDLAALTY